mgnify:CR=1 FL=1
MATTRSTTPRRKPLQHPQECPAAQAAQFPLECPKPRQMHPSEAVVIVREISKEAVKLFVMPKPDAVRSVLNETFGSLGWAQRRYFADGRLWCAVGVFNPYMEDYCFKDAAALEGKHPGSPERWKEETSFVAAAELWGIGSDIMALPPIVLRADQVPIVGIQKPGRKPNDPPQVVGYKLASPLTVDKFLRNPDTGEIIGVQFVDKDSRKITWEK